MAVNLLTIIKEPNDYFTFVLNGDTVNAIKNTRNDLTVVGNLAHIKTSNGANLISQQDVLYNNITIVDGVTSLVPTSPDDLFTKLISVGYFDWINGSGGGGVNRFDELEDTFSYFGKDGQVVVVNESELKLETLTLPDVSKLNQFPTPLVAFKMLRVNAAGTAYEFIDGVNTITQLIRNGFTTTTPSEDAVFDALALKANLVDLHESFEIIDYPILLANQDEFEIPEGKIAKLVYINGTVYLPLSANNVSEFNTFSQLDTTVSLINTAVIGEYVSIVYQ